MSSPAIAPDGTIYIGSKDSNIYAITGARKITLITPTSGTVGTTVTVAGIGYGSAETIRIDFGTTRSITTCISNLNGTFSTVFIVNTQPYGITSITTTDCTSASGPFSILSQIFSVTPTSGIVGTTVTVAGNGYGSAEIIRIDFGTTISICNIVSSINGTFSAVFTINYQSYGTTTIVATGYITSAKALSSFFIKYDVWSMFHHDVQHTGRSPYNGPTNPALKWSYTTGSYVSSSPAIAEDGTIYVGSYDKKLYAINPNGTLKWSYTTGGEIYYSSPAIAQDGTIYVGSCDRKLYAINPNGTLKWSYTTGSYVYSSPAIAQDGTIYVGSYDRKLYAINPNGTLKWSYITGSYVYSSPAIAQDGTIYVGSYDKKLYAINPNGTLKWLYTTGSSVESSPAIAQDGTIYVGSDDKKLYAINPNGTLKWSYITGSLIYYSSPAIAQDGTIYVGSCDRKLYAMNPNGTLKWSYTTGGYVYSSPAIAQDGTIYVGVFNDKKFYVINPNGTLKWSYTTGYYIASSPAIGRDGTIYVGSYDRNLYAIANAITKAEKITPLVISNLGNVKVYPNPAYKGQEITFDNLTSDNVTLRIYSIAGELVFETQGQNTIKWNLKNKDNEYVASGIYIYLLKDKVGFIKKGKIGVIK